MEKGQEGARGTRVCGGWGGAGSPAGEGPCLLPEGHHFPRKDTQDRESGNPHTWGLGFVPTLSGKDSQPPGLPHPLLTEQNCHED